MTTMTTSNIAALADEFGAIDAQIKALEERKAALRKELEKALDDGDAAIGQTWTVVRKDALSERLDTKALREAFGGMLHPYEKVSVTTRISAKPTAALDLLVA